jgi:hypothetical protein
MPKSEKIRSYWINDARRTTKKSQLIEIEGRRIRFDVIMDDIVKVTSRLCKSIPKLENRHEEVKEILEQFIIDVSSSKDLKGEI